MDGNALVSLVKSFLDPATTAGLILIPSIFIVYMIVDDNCDISVEVTGYIIYCKCWILLDSHILSSDHSRHVCSGNIEFSRVNA